VESARKKGLVENILYLLSRSYFDFADFMIQQAALRALGESINRDSKRLG
jgi:hypothetical protein